MIDMNAVLMVTSQILICLCIGALAARLYLSRKIRSFLAMLCIMDTIMDDYEEYLRNDQAIGDDSRAIRLRSVSQARYYASAFVEFYDNHKEET